MQVGRKIHNTNTCYNMEWTSRMICQVKESRPKGSCYVKEIRWKKANIFDILYFHLYEMSRIGKFLPTGNRLVVACDGDLKGMSCDN